MKSKQNAHAEHQSLDVLTLTELVLPEHANHYGTLFGPKGLALMGKTAFLMATRYSGQAFVLVGANQIEFLQPIPIGSILTIVAHVHKIGRSSMNVLVQASIEALQKEHAPVLAMRGSFDLVAVDKQGHPTSIAKSISKIDTDTQPKISAN